jgi:hypothetical protein
MSAAAVSALEIAGASAAWSEAPIRGLVMMRVLRSKSILRRIIKTALFALNVREADP